MGKKFDVKITVESIAEPCNSGMQVGDTCYCERKGGYGLRMRGTDGWCPELLNSVMPALSAMAFGGSLPWEDADGKALSACPDPHCRVVASVQKIGESEPTNKDLEREAAKLVKEDPEQS